MRIVQLSDIHLSSSNLEALQNFYREALIKDLKTFHNEKPIDIILITGDLVDKGGDSLGDNAYRTFNEEFINPILSELNISKDKMLFIPGNHDINREFVDKENEFYLAANLTKDNANDYLKNTRNSFERTNKRIQKFKEFEKEFHVKKDNYLYSNNESLSIENDNGIKVGFALINDSWRCSSALEKEQHFIGFNQLFNAKKYFSDANTEFNLAVFHHPLDAFNPTESEEIENILKSQNFDVAIFGHSHEHKFETLISSNGGFLALNGRSAFNNVNETKSKFQSGYNILDLDIKARTYNLFARKFIKSNGYRFDKDVESLTDGIYCGQISKKPDYFKLNTSSNNTDGTLPNGYSADVNRIVKLLIGKSLYPNPFIFARELIQNSVDACNRVKEKNTLSQPKITVNINTDENYFEVIDEGDGMSKKILKEHFSIIGKSISQEFNDSNGSFNLISQFGIGFISTFIVAQKVTIFTKNEFDERVAFEIIDVFKGFNYNISNNGYGIGNAQSGTAIRVYLKKEYNSINLLSFARNYCRHIDNIEFYLNSLRQPYLESWNIEGGDYTYYDKNSKYEIKLTIGNFPQHIVASNSGFLINHFAPQLIPYRFPFIIRGEVNFTPKSIDFDISRTNIIETSKSRDFKKEVSISLRKLFRQVLESNDNTLIPLVVNHLQYYLCNFDANQKMISESYSDFFSKKELINLCLEYSLFDFKNRLENLSEIINQLKRMQISNIYVSQQNSINDYENLVSRYLYDTGNLVITPKLIQIQFRDGQQSVDTIQFLQVIAQECGFHIVQTNTIQPSEITDMKMNKNDFPKQIIQQLTAIEKENQIQIDIARFSKTSKPFARFGNEYFINCEHPGFQSVLLNIANISDEVLKVYFSGLLGISLS